MPARAEPPPGARCADIAAALDEPIEATASYSPVWLMLEAPGPWARDALMGCSLGDEVARELAGWADARDVRIQLIRRTPRREPPPGGVHACFVADFRVPGAPVVMEGSVRDPLDVLAFDLDDLAGARGLRPLAEPAYFTCTHGKHDPCCAVRGRRVAVALRARFGARAWETSHLGGCRFAATVLELPSGTVLGRVGPAGGGVVRGHAGTPLPAQAAIRALAEAGTDGARFVACASDGPSRWRVELEVAGAVRPVWVDAAPLDPPRLIQCHNERASRPLRLVAAADG